MLWTSCGSCSKNEFLKFFNVSLKTFLSLWNLSWNNFVSLWCSYTLFSLFQINQLFPAYHSLFHQQKWMNTLKRNEYHWQSHQFLKVLCLEILVQSHHSILLYANICSLNVPLFLLLSKILLFQTKQWLNYITFEGLQLSNLLFKK